MKTKIEILKQIDDQNDIKWLLFWLIGIQVMLVWNNIFLNSPAFSLLKEAFFNSFKIGFIVIVFSLLLSWGMINLSLYLKNRNNWIYHYLFTFVINLIRSIPQILGVLIGYIVLTFILNNEMLKSEFMVIVFIGFVISFFVFLELFDTMGNRIEQFKKNDFYPAMLVSGISEYRIVNVEIFYKNSLGYIFHKLISMFGVALFLQCSIDFIISVGLSTDVSLSNFPITLGSLLAKMDSKQDILAIGKTLTDPLYGINLFFEHLQGISAAFIIVFTLMSIFKISNGFVKRISR